MAVKELDISIDPPKFGWLRITIELAGTCHIFDASDVLNDPVTELANACLVLLDGPNSTTVGFWLEPLWHMLELQAYDNGLTTVTFSCFADENQLNPKSKATTSVDTKSLCRHILTRLRRMHEATGAGQYPRYECWGKEFPDAEVSTAFDRIRSP
jgi:hypothetical protein